MTAWNASLSNLLDGASQTAEEGVDVDDAYRHLRAGTRQGVPGVFYAATSQSATATFPGPYRLSMGWK